MDYEKKYKEALEIAKRCYKDLNNLDGVVSTMSKDFFEEVFPELKESEDEESKKWILEYLYDGMRKSDEQFKNQFECAIAWLEKQGKQKLDDKVEPKLNIGDWITFYGSEPFKILKVESEQNGILDYLLLEPSGRSTYYDKKYVDENVRLWTIQDAKDGDVLCYEDEMFILKNYVLFHKIVYHCCYDGKNFIPHSIYSFTKDDFNNVHPATKEQRDLLFQKMKEAGYVWDAEKKELKQKEQEPINECNTNEPTIDEARKWNEAYEKGYSLGYENGRNEQKPIDAIAKMKQVEWSEEDEKLYNSALWHVKNSCSNGGKNSGEFEVYNWLKSLKERIHNIS